MKNFLRILGIGLISVFFIACNGGNKVKISKTGEKLMSHAWKLQPNETLDAASDSLKNATNVTADVQLKGDVKKIADFIAETLVFDRDKKDASKLAYSSTIGKGFLSSKVVGYWELSDDDILTLKQWDDSKGEEMAPVKYKIVEINDKKLVLQNEDTKGVKIYFPK